GAGTLAVTPGIMYFGSLAVGTTKSLIGTLSASGSSVVISSAGTNSAEYTMSGIKLPLTIAAGKTASVTLTFKPQSSGAASARHRSRVTQVTRPLRKHCREQEFPPEDRYPRRATV